MFAIGSTDLVAFFVFTPALVGSSLYITIKSIGMLWFMSVNILITIIIGSTLEWILIKITRAPRDLSTAFFGIDVNSTNFAYTLDGYLSMTDRFSTHLNILPFHVMIFHIGAIFLWSYVYNIVRFYLWLANNAYKPKPMNLALCTFNRWSNCWVYDRCYPSATEGASCWFGFGDGPIFLYHIRIHSEAATPTVTLIVGANLLGGLQGSWKHLSIIIGIIVIRYIAQPILGICIVKAAIHFGLVNSDPLYQFILLLQFDLPPAIQIERTSTIQ
ncbi:hypothetical protein EZV62_013844 [Acer yangbiense]|uniref:Uncharacterized protein n=1 Tax=Acer yangbiense TaxID=1000413 RepID=A0A5C7HQE9_9ROSI|nr:hypothetical protein EZV62_013844 [Acer yangbiense]